VGNSYVYYNDLPRLLEALASPEGGGRGIKTGTCVRGGASLKWLLKRGSKENLVDEDDEPRPGQRRIPSANGGKSVKRLLTGTAAGWDFCVLNDYSQQAPNPKKRKESIEVLSTGIAPLLAECGATPVLYVTPAYRAHAKGSQTIGSWADFTQKQEEGHSEYADRLEEALYSYDAYQDALMSVNAALDAAEDAASGDEADGEADGDSSGEADRTASRPRPRAGSGGEWGQHHDTTQEEGDSGGSSPWGDGGDGPGGTSAADGAVSGQSAEAAEAEEEEGALRASDDLTAAAAAAALVHARRARPPRKRVAVASVNEAYARVRAERPGLWRDLFVDDDFHPSPVGSYLAACVLHAALFKRAPPLANAVPRDAAELFSRARRPLSEGQPSGRLPTRDEMLYLHEVADPDAPRNARAEARAVARAETRAAGASS